MARSWDYILEHFVILTEPWGGMQAGWITTEHAADLAGVPKSCRVVAEGGVLKRDDFPQLYEVFGAAGFPYGGGLEEFSVPDLRGRIAVETAKSDATFCPTCRRPFKTDNANRRVCRLCKEPILKMHKYRFVKSEVEHRNCSDPESYKAREEPGG